MTTKLMFVAAHVTEFSIRMMCHLLGVSRSWFHAWRRTASSREERASRRAALAEIIKEIYDASHGRYGAPRIHAELLHRGNRISKTCA